MPIQALSIQALSALTTGRANELFQTDVDSRQTELRERIGGRRILVIGGAGSIGSATVHALADFSPQTLHVVDQSENNLAELVRDLRSRAKLAVPDFRALPLDFGSPVMQRFLLESPPYDYVLNFAALKHVRSEKDTYSLLQMLDTNVVKAARFMRWLADTTAAPRYFCVSTDKAANPVNLMGASKRFMEDLIFSGEVAPTWKAQVTSARFANVAFSDGSLLDSFLKRLQKRQPLTVPRETQRYFISLREAGQICLLAAVCAPHCHLLIPRLDPAHDLRDLQTVAVEVLRYHGLEPCFYDHEDEARASVESDLAKGGYPVLLTPLDTSGEKPYEEFLGAGETAVEVGMADLLGIKYLPAPAGAVATFLRLAEDFVARPDLKVRKEDLVLAMSAIVSQLRHVETGKNLDERM